MKRSSNKWIIMSGGFAGLLVWAYDYDFFLNAGGPETPVSDAILKTLHLQGMEYPFFVLLPMLVLITVGIVVGIGVARLLRFYH